MEKNRNEKWKMYAEYWNSCNLVKTKLLMNRIKKRRKINAIIDLIVVIVREKKWKFSPGFI
jgi:hypothetical protein